MNLATIEPALLAVAAIVTGLPASACVFENAPRPMVPALATLSWLSRTGVGIDETSWDYAEAADPLDEMTPSVSGLRYVVVQFAVEVYADQRSGHNASAIVERARTRLRWPRVLAALDAAGLALATVGPATVADYAGDGGRQVSRSLFELRLNASAVETDESGRTSYIATVTASGTVLDVDGTALPDSLQPAPEIP